MSFFSAEQMSAAGGTRNASARFVFVLTVAALVIGGAIFDVSAEGRASGSGRLLVEGEVDKWSRNGDEIELWFSCGDFQIDPQRDVRVNLPPGGTLLLKACSEAGSRSEWMQRARIEDRGILVQKRYELFPLEGRGSSSDAGLEMSAWTFEPARNGTTRVSVLYRSDARWVVDLTVRVGGGAPSPRIDWPHEEGMLSVRYTDQVSVQGRGGLSKADFWVGQRVYFLPGQTIDDEFLDRRLPSSTGDVIYGRTGLSFDPENPKIAGQTFRVREVEPHIRFDRPFPENMRNRWNSTFPFKVWIETRSGGSPRRDVPRVGTIHRDRVPMIPPGLKMSCMSGPDSHESPPGCPTFRWGELTYWAFSHKDNRFGMTIVAYDRSGDVVRRWSKTGARYVWRIEVNGSDRTVTFRGQADRTIVMSWDELRVR